jgi:hypothetical protein
MLILVHISIMCAPYEIYLVRTFHEMLVFSTLDMFVACFENATLARWCVFSTFIF